MLSEGNVSAFDHQKGIIAITPTSIPPQELNANLIVLCDLNGSMIQNEVDVSSDLDIHLELYRNFAEIKSICHTHSPFATSWAQAQRSVPILGTTHADVANSSIPCTKPLDDYQDAGKYNKMISSSIINVFESISYLDVPMVLIARHGPFAWGKSTAQAIKNIQLCENICQLAYQTLNLNNAITPLNDLYIRNHFRRS